MDRHSEMDRTRKNEPEIIVGVVTQDFDTSGSKRSNAFGHPVSLSLRTAQINNALRIQGLVRLFDIREVIIEYTEQTLNPKLVVDTLTASEFDPCS
jgi:hypothetical protein